MRMKRTLFFLLCSLMLLGSLPAVAEEVVTPEEIIEKVREAAAYLAEQGEDGLASFMETEGPWVWKDTFVFVYSCEQNIMAAHPDTSLVGYELTAFVDTRGVYFSMELCEAAHQPNGGWGEYWWPKLGSDVPERKISYMLTVPGQPYEVGAGIFNPEMTLEELNRLLE
jgi:signal transduction histidine kinase